MFGRCREYVVKSAILYYGAILHYRKQPHAVLGNELDVLTCDFEYFLVNLEFQNMPNSKACQIFNKKRF